MKSRKVCLAKTIDEIEKHMNISKRQRLLYVSQYDPFQDKDAIIPKDIQPHADDLKRHMLMENVF